MNKIVKSRLALRTVSDTERIAVYKAIRWSYIDHEQLLEISNDKEFELARPMILEGLSCRLVDFEKSKTLCKLINVNPRIKYPENYN